MYDSNYIEQVVRLHVSLFYQICVYYLIPVKCLRHKTWEGFDNLISLTHPSLAFQKVSQGCIYTKQNQDLVLKCIHTYTSSDQVPTRMCQNGPHWRHIQNHVLFTNNIVTLLNTRQYFTAHQCDLKIYLRVSSLHFGSSFPAESSLTPDSPG